MGGVSRLGKIWFLALGLMACDGTSSSRGKNVTNKTPSNDVNGVPAVTQPGTFQVASDSDLEAPLHQAFEKARNEGLATFTVLIAPGTYKRSIDLTDPRDSGRLALVVAGAGPAPAVLAGGNVKLDGVSATLRNVVVEKAQKPAAAVVLRVEKSALLEGVAVIGSSVADQQLNDPIVSVHTSRARATAVVRDSWFLQNKSPSGAGAALDFTADPGRSFASIELEAVAFAGNETPYSLRPRYADEVRLRGVIFHEPKVTQAAIYLNSPMVKLSLEGGAIAGARRALEYMVNVDAKRSDYTTATMHGTSVQLAAPIPAEDFEQADVQTKAAAGAPSLDAAAAAARSGEKPSAAKLGL